MRNNVFSRIRVFYAAAEPIKYEKYTFNGHVEMPTGIRAFLNVPFIHQHL